MFSFKHLFCAFAALCLATAAQAAGFDDGMAAFNRGDFKGAYEQWLPRAEKGEARAQGMLGKLLFFGLGTVKNENEALAWLRKASDQNDPVGLTNLGHLYSNGTGGLQRDRAHGINLIQKAALQGYPNAEYAISIFLSTGNGLPRNRHLANLYMQKALSGFLPLARQNDIDAQSYVASIFIHNERLKLTDIDLDREQVVSWLRNAAEKGLPYAQLQLGHQYEKGMLLVTDEALAAQWYAKAAEHSYPVAQFALSGLYQDGRGVEKDDAKTLTLLKQAADQRFVVAEYQLGMRYAEGHGVGKDRALARLWLQKAADRDWPPARTALQELDDADDTPKQ